MKHVTFVDQQDGVNLKERVEAWLRDNRDVVDEIVNIEYSNYNTIYSATITYEERRRK